MRPRPRSGAAFRPCLRTYTTCRTGSSASTPSPGAPNRRTCGCSRWCPRGAMCSSKRCAPPTLNAPGGGSSRSRKYGPGCACSSRAAWRSPRTAPRSPPNWATAWRSSRPTAPPRASSPMATGPTRPICASSWTATWPSSSSPSPSTARRARGASRSTRWPWASATCPTCPPAPACGPTAWATCCASPPSARIRASSWPGARARCSTATARPCTLKRPWQRSRTPAAPPAPPRSTSTSPRSRPRPCPATAGLWSSAPRPPTASPSPRRSMRTCAASTGTMRSGAMRARLRCPRCGASRRAPSAPGSPPHGRAWARQTKVPRLSPDPAAAQTILALAGADATRLA